MQFIETRGNDHQREPHVTFSQAILRPMSSFGGLYAPAQFPVLSDKFFARHVNSSYQVLAQAVLACWEVDIDADVIATALQRYDHFDDAQEPAPLAEVSEDLFVSELYHGPTRAFKDMALQPFGVVLSHLAQQQGEHYLILAATSGDTGPATLETFKNQPNIKVVCLYPDGGTSDVQRLQMVTEQASNLKVIGIHGDFDDAQTALKTLLSSDSFQAALAQKNTHLSAANSVNFGRIIFQQIYHIYSYLILVRRNRIALGDKVYLNVPSGNFGNALGGYYAMKQGLPVEKILISSNQNHVLTDFIRTGHYDLRERRVVGTSSPAMDILKSSNIERILFDLYGASRTRQLMEALEVERHYQLTQAELAQLQMIFSADYADDVEVNQYIRQNFAGGYLLDPHTATCFKAHANCRDKALPSIIYSTAEWTKFSPTIANALDDVADLPDEKALPLVAEKANIDVPPVITALFDKPLAHTAVIDKRDIEQEILKFL